MSDEKRNKICQDLNPYDKGDWSIFKFVEKNFIEEFGDNDAIDKVFCGLAPMMGPYNCINVYIGKNRKRATLPDYFMGFPIIKTYESKCKNYKQLIEK